MKKAILLTIAISAAAGAVCVFMMEPVGAQLLEEYQTQTGAFAGSEGAGIETTRDVREVVALIIKAALGIIGTLFLGYAIFGGYMIMTAAGNDEKVGKGKKTLITAVIGVAVVLCAYAITLAVARIIMPAVPESGIEFYTEPDYSDYYNRDPLRDSPRDMVPF